MTLRARIGMVNFINTAPIYEVWRQRVSEPGWEVTEAVPSVLNRMIRGGDLDLGFVSSLEFGRNPRQYMIMPALSISSTGAVGSVFFLSRVPFEDLDGRAIAFSAQSRSSAALARIVCEEFMAIRPSYFQADIEDGIDNVEAMVVIGDDALRLATDVRFPFRLDLGEIWFAHTGLPFVFALWVVRRDFVAADPETVRDVHRTLINCLAEGKKDLGRISREVAGRVPLEPSRCYQYLAGLEYDLDDNKVLGLMKFYEILAARGDISAPVELEIWYP